jgi:SAM-dependent methyltransferase
MKVRDSGMPEREYWESFFEPEVLLSSLLGPQVMGDGAEFGCGYGTFTLPAAQRTQGTLHTFDIEQAMVEQTHERLAKHSITNVRVNCCDLLKQGTGLATKSLAFVLIFNLLHAEQPQRFISEAQRLLQPGGKVALIHWRTDIPTPRGPDLSIRPSAAAMADLLIEAGFSGVQIVPFDQGNPYHVGVIGRKK